MIDETTQVMCDMVGCNRPKGHSSAHGIDMGNGLILAPFGGGEGEMSDFFDTDLICDQCNSKMVASKGSNGGGIIKCTYGKCGQEYTVSNDGRISSTLTTLWPSGMNPTSVMYRQAIMYKYDGWVFDAKARYILGTCTVDEMNVNLNEAKRVYDEWCANNPPPVARVPWWKRLLGYKGIKFP
jgi:hypothetical protein